MLSPIEAERERRGMKRVFLFAAVLAVVALLRWIGGCMAAEEPKKVASTSTSTSTSTSPGVAGEEVSGLVERVTDGDTIRLDTPRYGVLKIRLHGIDAPELRQTCTEDPDGPDGKREPERFACGVEASQELEDVIDGSQVTCQLTEKDRYGRWVGRCRVSGLMGDVDLSREMVERGYALAFTKYSTDYVAEEHGARKGGRGLFAPGVEMQEPGEYRKARRAGH